MTDQIDDAGGTAPVADPPVHVSVISPVYNEEDSVQPLVERISAALRPLGTPFEIILVNDGSVDQTWSRMAALAEQHPELVVIDLARNYGQTTAVMAGIDAARGEIIVPIDADLQNEPDDIPQLIERLDDGFDLVSGWRVDRQDSAIKRKFVSRMANRLISAVSGVRLHDYGCSLKAYRASVLSQVRLYGEMHRFLPIYVAWNGGRITEMAVRHHPRTTGKSKYGLERIAKVILDILVVKFLDKYFTKPIYVFGGFGILCMLAGVLSFAWMIVLKLVYGISFIMTPLPLLVVFGFMCGVLGILLGLISELLVRTYFESQDKRPYLLKRIIRHGGGAPQDSRQTA